MTTLPFPFNEFHKFVAKKVCDNKFTIVTYFDVLCFVSLKSCVLSKWANILGKIVFKAAFNNWASENENVNTNCAYERARFKKYFIQKMHLKKETCKNINMEIASTIIMHHEKRTQKNGMSFYFKVCSCVYISVFTFSFSCAQLSYDFLYSLYWMFRSVIYPWLEAIKSLRVSPKQFAYFFYIYV